MRINIEVTDDNGQRIAGYAIHSPHNIMGITEPDNAQWCSYYDDGRGNGDALGDKVDEYALPEAMQKLGRVIYERERDLLGAAVQFDRRHAQMYPFGCPRRCGACQARFDAVVGGTSQPGAFEMWQKGEELRGRHLVQQFGYRASLALLAHESLGQLLHWRYMAECESWWNPVEGPAFKVGTVEESLAKLEARGVSKAWVDSILGPAPGVESEAEIPR